MTKKLKEPEQNRPPSTESWSDGFSSGVEHACLTLYCIVSIHLYSASSARDPERREQSWENEKRRLAHQLIKWIAQKEGVGYVCTC